MYEASSAYDTLYPDPEDLFDEVWLPKRACNLSPTYQCHTTPFTPPNDPSIDHWLDTIKLKPSCQACGCDLITVDSTCEECNLRYA